MKVLLESLVYWHWFILGVILMIAETLLPGSFLLWFGVGALATGLVLLALPGLAWQVQLLLFAVIAVGAIIAWRRYRVANPELSSHPNLNQRSAQYIGRRFTLEEPVVDGFGRLHVDDTQWRIAGPDLPTGTLVAVVGVDGMVLRIARAE